MPLTLKLAPDAQLHDGVLDDVSCANGLPIVGATAHNRRGRGLFEHVGLKTLCFQRLHQKTNMRGPPPPPQTTTTKRKTATTTTTPKPTPTATATATTFS